MHTPRRPSFSADDPRLALAILGTLVLLSLLIVLRADFRGSAIREAGPPNPGPVAGLAPAALRDARALVLAELERQAYPGAALAAGRGQSIDLVEAYGRIGWREAAAPVSAETTMYDLASVTKAVATTIAVLLLVEDGAISLDDPVQPHLPAFEGEHKERVTWRHLLTHTSGLPGGAVIRGDTPEERARRLLRTRIVGPGHTMTYTDLGFLVLWEAAERVAGEPLEGFLERRVWRPLGMENTAFSPGQDCEACAPTLRLSTGVPFRGQPSDLLARRLGGVTGNAGLFSTARDMARFAAMIAGGGQLGDVRILRPATVRELFRQQEGAGRRTLGWVAFCPAENGQGEESCADPIAFGHTGWSGASLWIEPEGGAWVVLLSNRSYDVRAEPRMGWLREAIFTALTGRAIPDPPEPG